MKLHIFVTLENTIHALDICMLVAVVSYFQLTFLKVRKKVENFAPTALGTPLVARRKNDCWVAHTLSFVLEHKSFFCIKC